MTWQAKGKKKKKERSEQRLEKKPTKRAKGGKRPLSICGMVLRGNQQTEKKQKSEGGMHAYWLSSGAMHSSNRNRKQRYVSSLERIEGWDVWTSFLELLEKISPSPKLQRSRKKSIPVFVFANFFFSTHSFFLTWNTSLLTRYTLSKTPSLPARTSTRNLKNVLVPDTAKNVLGTGL